MKTANRTTRYKCTDRCLQDKDNTTISTKTQN